MIYDFYSHFIECSFLQHPQTNTPPVTLNVASFTHKNTHTHQADASLFLQQSSHGRQEPSKATMFLKDRYDKHVTKFDFDKIEYDKVIRTV